VTDASYLFSLTTIEPQWMVDQCSAIHYIPSLFFYLSVVQPTGH